MNMRMFKFVGVDKKTNQPETYFVCAWNLAHATIILNNPTAHAENYELELSRHWGSKSAEEITELVDGLLQKHSK